ncbi:MAG: TetR/AcrR family transcriptional regulator [Rhodococcus sp. (in: high G+C Gram-positive bacteria)]|uniref:TetR/AcrR family transcriptional regulator n=1 Tax=Rhodococcus sp. EPR-157 TaxID=1813677 RepID=UPI0007BB7ED9|nr:TetR/AcrR family transcriptional regulator [Rhodococcus sp. EPR-157]KZF01641.1 TetR family transcriptional regulator [Rhodococcus sp. EPR-157]
MSTSETDTATGRPYRGSTPGQRRETRREQLLDAAVEVFGTTGYRSASIDRICATAGLTKRYFYESFDSSEDLLEAVYRRATATMLTSIHPPTTSAAIGPETSAEEVLQAALSNFFRTIADDPRSARIVLLEVLGVSAEIDALYRQTTSLFVDAVLALATSVGIANGLAGPNRRTLAIGLVGAVLMMTQQWLLAPDSEPLDGIIAGAHTILGAVAFGRLD